MSGFEVVESVKVRGGREEVFRLVSDVAGWPRLSASFRAAEVWLREGPRCLTSFTSQHDGNDYALVSYREEEPPRRLRFEHLNPSRWFRTHAGEWSFEPEGEATRVTLRHRIEPRALPARAVGVVVRGWVLGPHSRQMLGELRDSIEARIGAPEEEARW